jgi:hypothetical protein
VSSCLPPINLLPAASAPLANGDKYFEFNDNLIALLAKHSAAYYSFIRGEYPLSNKASFIHFSISSSYKLSNMPSLAINTISFSYIICMLSSALYGSLLLVPH